MATARARSSAAPREADTISTPGASARAETQAPASASRCAASDASMKRREGWTITTDLSPGRRAGSPEQPRNAAVNRTIARTPGFGYQAPAPSYDVRVVRREVWYFARVVLADSVTDSCSTTSPRRAP